MGDVILAGMFLAFATLVVLVPYFSNREGNKNRPEKLDGKGDWIVTERGTGFATTSICLVRRYNNRDTNIIRVATIRDDAEDWTTRYEEAMAVARERLASLQADK